MKQKSFLCSNVNVSDAAAPGDGVVNDNSTSKQMVFDKCCQCPCEWDKYGVSLLKQMTNVAENEAGGHVRIGNKQLRFLAYSMFTSMKHGYLGKHNR